MAVYSVTGDGGRWQTEPDKVRHDIEWYVWSIRQATREGVSRCLLPRAATTPVHLCHVVMVFTRSLTVCKTNHPRRNSHASTPDLQLFNGLDYGCTLPDKSCNWRGVKLLLCELQYETHRSKYQMEGSEWLRRERWRWRTGWKIGGSWAEVQWADRREQILLILQCGQRIEKTGTQAEVCHPGPTAKTRQSGRVLQAEQSSVQLFGKLHKLKAHSCWNCSAYQSALWKPCHSQAGLDRFTPRLQGGTTTQVALCISKKKIEAKVIVRRNCVSPKSNSTFNYWLNCHMGIRTDTNFSKVVQ